MIWVSFLMVGDALRRRPDDMECCKQYACGTSLSILGEVLRSRPDYTECCTEYDLGIIFDIGRSVAKQGG